MKKKVIARVLKCEEFRLEECLKNNKNEVFLSDYTLKINVNKAIKSVRISNSLGQLVPIPIVDNLFQLNESGIYLIEVTLSNMHAIRKKLIVLK